MDTRSSRKRKCSEEVDEATKRTKTSLAELLREAFNERSWEKLNIVFDKNSKWLYYGSSKQKSIGKRDLRDLTTEFAWIIQSTILQNITPILPYLNTWLDNLLLFFHHNRMSFNYKPLLQHNLIKDTTLENDYLASICLEKNLFNLSFLFYLIERNWDQILHLLKTKQELIAEDLVRNVIDLAIENKEIAVVAKCLQEMPHSFPYNFYPSFRYLETFELKSFIEALQTLDLHFWIVQVYSHLSKWSDVEKCLVKSQYQTPEIVSNVIFLACNSMEDEDTVIESLLLCFSFPEPFLKKLDADCFEDALIFGIVKKDVILLRSLINYVDLEQSFIAGSDLDSVIDENFLFAIIPRNERAIMRLLISAGISTFHRSFETTEYSWRSKGHIMTQLLPLNDSLGHLKLLHRSGLCSNKRLFELHEEYARCYEREKNSPTAFQARLIKYVPVQIKEKVLEYLHFVASNPLSLLDLTRLAVSHQLRALPGRKERIEALPIPSYTKYLLNFSDLVAVAEQDEDLDSIAVEEQDEDLDSIAVEEQDEDLD